MIVAVIPARSGSKRIPKKNIRDFCGKPIIAWSIEAARAAQLFDRVIVSTDCVEIAAVARTCGAEVPFMRSARLADDHTGTTEVIADAIRALRADGLVAELVCCLYATAPFVRSEDLRRGLDILRSSGADFAFAVTPYEFPIQRAVRITPAGRVAMFQPECFSVRSQDLEQAWHDAGQFYWGRAEAWQGQRMMFSHISAPVPLARHRVQDIDTPDDWVRAEWMFKALRATGDGLPGEGEPA